MSALDLQASACIEFSPFSQQSVNKMSPFSYADKIETPILLIHGEADNNTGTFPIQSERFYNALKGEGATVRFVLLPLEAHGYQGRESVLHMLWEMGHWLDKYVKPSNPVARDGSDSRVDEEPVRGFALGDFIR